MLLFFFNGHGYFLSLADRAFSSALLLENLAEERQEPLMVHFCDARYRN
jgi:hypothetical protein